MDCSVKINNVAVTPETVKHVLKIVMDNLTEKVSKIIESINISTESPWIILQLNLGMEKICSKLLTMEQKPQQVEEAVNWCRAGGESRPNCARNLHRMP